MLRTRAIGLVGLLTVLAAIAGCSSSHPGSSTTGGRAAAPAPIPISLAKMPATVLGQQRDDLAQEAAGNAQAKANGEHLAAVYSAAIPAYQAAYGGPGIKVGYGQMTGDVIVQLVVVNGMIPAPLITPDAQIEFVTAVGSQDFVQAPGSTATRCAASPYQTLPLKSATAADVAAARKSVLAGTQSAVTCVRSDRSRNVSIELSVPLILATAGPPASKRAAAVAAEVDRIWASMVG